MRLTTATHVPPSVRLQTHLFCAILKLAVDSASMVCHEEGQRRVGFA